MNRPKISLIRVLIIGIALLTFFVPSITFAQTIDFGSDFTYQGYVEGDGSPITGTCDFAFNLFDDPTVGTQIGATQNVAGVNVVGGVFTVNLDFGEPAFNGIDHFLEISVGCGGGTALLSPRQPITPAPYALGMYGLYTQPNATSPNVIGGWHGNSVGAGVFGATISGGGNAININSVTDSYGTIGGGSFNTTSGFVATVGGGFRSTASGFAATVGGGNFNTASGVVATVGGGGNNIASGSHVTVGGGLSNSASGFAATVGGGQSNTASEDFATVGGGDFNIASADYGTIAGGGRSDPNNPATGNRVTDAYGTVGGGGNNQAGDNAGSTTDAQFATVSGGFENTASDTFATVGGGATNTASGIVATVGGGVSNNASSDRATVAGGELNTASGSASTIGGGVSNTASGSGSTIGGGGGNSANGELATVGGGNNNTAGGRFATVPGGLLNTAAAEYSFAAGRSASVDATHANAFVWSGTNDVAGTDSWGAGTLTARAPGGVRFYSAASGIANGVELPANGGAWASLSDRNAKFNFADVDTQTVLQTLMSVPITTWSYNGQSADIRHMGPVAQDFYAAFGVGEDDIRITTVDADGVALASIQGLYTLVQSQAAELEAQRIINAELYERIAALESLAAGNGLSLPIIGAGIMPLLAVFALARRKK